MGFTPTKDQIMAAIDGRKWYNSQNKQFFVVSGAPGTGKTTFCRYLIDEIGLDLNQVLFVSYMGKAATRMAQSGINAKTIDSAIYYYVKEPEFDESGRIIITNKGVPSIKLKKKLKESLPKRYKLIVVEEYGMLNEQYGKDLASYNRPIIFLGDDNQISPPFGNRFISWDPDVTLRQIMRQEEGNPIVWLCQQIIHDRHIETGTYGDSIVLKKNQLNKELLVKSDIVITQSNKLRYETNMLFRSEFRNYKKLDMIHLNEKVICRKNNWGKSVNNIYMTNGMTGYVDYIYADDLTHDTFVFDFRPDFLDRSYHHIKSDYKSFFCDPNVDEQERVLFKDKFEFAYAITDYSSQGSEWDTVLCCDEHRGSKEEHLRRIYTAVSRARKKVYLVL